MNNCVPATLVVVDMQDYYLEGCTSRDRDQLLEAARQEIARAHAQGWSVVFLEYVMDGYELGNTNESLTSPLQGYSLTATVVKSTWDGSSALLKACREQCFPINRFRVLGVFTHQCVLSTVAGLRLLQPDCTVEVATAACWPNAEPSWSWFHDLVASTRVLLLP